jgi:hypothetical protein
MKDHVGAVGLGCSVFYCFCINPYSQKKERIVHESLVVLDSHAQHQHSMSISAGIKPMPFESNRTSNNPAPTPNNSLNQTNLHGLALHRRPLLASLSSVAV